MKLKIKAFTLIECIISLFILSVMAWIFLLMYGNAVKIYKQSAVMQQKFDQQINIAAEETLYDDTVPVDDRLAYKAPDMEFKISYSDINSAAQNKNCTINATVYEILLDRFGHKPSDEDYDTEDSDIGNYSYYYTPFTPYTEEES